MRDGPRAGRTWLLDDLRLHARVRIASFPVGFGHRGNTDGETRLHERVTTSNPKPILEHRARERFVALDLNATNPHKGSLVDVKDDSEF